MTANDKELNSYQELYRDMAKEYALLKIKYDLLRNKHEKVLDKLKNNVL
tara:strand:+ start:1700 stop:1846 length:147 start_codon:yes stop_codon:yes gene_type:complete